MAAEEILVICPFTAEARLLASLLPNCRQINNRTWQSRAVVIQTFNGCGREPLLDYLNASTNWQKFSRVVLFGAAGALASAIEPGQVFTCNQLLFDIQKITLEPLVPGNFSGSRFTSQKNPETGQKNPNSQNLEFKAVDAGISNIKSQPFPEEITQITVQNPVLSGLERLELFKRTGAGIVDMESFFFAREVIALGLKPLIIRFVSDTATQAFKLPFASNVKHGVTSFRQQILNLLNFSA